MAKEHKAWTWANRIEFVWSLIERTGIWAGWFFMLVAGPTGHAIGGLTALYYVIPLSAMGIALLVVGFRRRAKIEAGQRSIPIRREYTKEKILILGLIEPDGCVRDCTFVECDIYGPAVLCCSGGYNSMIELSYHGSSMDALFLPLAHSTKRPDGSIGLDNCTFKRCTLYNITIAGEPENIKDIMKKMTVHSEPPVPDTPDSPPKEPELPPPEE